MALPEVSPYPLTIGAVWAWDELEIGLIAENIWHFKKFHRTYQQ